MRPRRGRPARRLHDARQAGAPGRRSPPPRPRCMAALCGEGAETPARQDPRRRRVQGRRGQDRALEHPRHRHPHRRPRREDRPPDRRRGRPPAAHPRLGAVHPRRDAGAGRRHARHRRRRAVHRLRWKAPTRRRFLLHYNFPPYSRRRDRPHGLARPPRDRPRQARLARHPPDAAAAPRVPLHDPRRLGDHRVRTAPPRWRRSAAPRSR